MWIVELAIDCIAAAAWRLRGWRRYASAFVALCLNACGISPEPVPLCASRRKIGDLTEFIVADVVGAPAAMVAWFYHQYPSPDPDCWREFCTIFGHASPPPHTLVGRGGGSSMHVTVEVGLGPHPWYKLTWLETGSSRGGSCLIGSLLPSEIFNLTAWKPFD